MSDDDERIKNLILFKIPATDSEIADMNPWPFIIALIIMIIVFVVGIYFTK